MFSNFGKITGNRPREAESADARLGIRRHDPDRESRRKKSAAEPEGGLFQDDDTATVTVEALRLFLENFLLELAPQKIETNAEKNISDEAKRLAAENAPAPTIDSAAAKASNAYRHTAQGTKHAAPPAQPPQPVAADAIDLPSEDVRTIHKLLEDLKILSARGVEYLTIERGKTFLASLVAAVAKSTP